MKTREQIESMQRLMRNAERIALSTCGPNSRERALSFGALDILAWILGQPNQLERDFAKFTEKDIRTSLK
jgi:hypothetical protein